MAPKKSRNAEERLKQRRKKKTNNQMVDLNQITSIIIYAIMN